MPAIVLRQVVKEFSTAAGQLRILDGIDLELEPGQALAVLGPSGSGKSTLLHLLGTLDRPTSGQLEVLGCRPAEMNDEQLADFRNSQVGFVFQEHYLLPQLSALENVLVPALAAGRADKARVTRARQLLDQVGLAERTGAWPAQLSGGERQRVAVARALLLEPQLVLADEPTGNLDHENAQAVGRLLVDLCGDRQSILVCVTHSEPLSRLFPRRLWLDQGRLVESPGQAAPPVAPRPHGDSP